MVNDEFRRNSVVITGASSGIGRCLALQLGERGALLTLAARNEAELQRVASQCRDRGGAAVAVVTDVSDEAQCSSLIDRAVAEYGRLDTLVNNAGLGMQAPFVELDDLAVMRRIMDVNFWGSVYCTHRALPHLAATRGRIVAIISGGGLFVTPFAIGYGASKHAMTGFFDTLRFELRRTGVSVTSIYPDWVATGISARACLADGTPRGGVVAQEERAMSAEECAAFILKAAAKRKRQAAPARIRLGALLAPIVPNRVDKIAAKAFAGEDARRFC